MLLSHVSTIFLLTGPLWTFLAIYLNFDALYVSISVASSSGIFSFYFSFDLDSSELVYCFLWIVLYFKDPTNVILLLKSGSFLFMILSNAFVYDIELLICLTRSSTGSVLILSLFLVEVSVYLVYKDFRLSLTEFFYLNLRMLKLLRSPWEANYQ